MKKELNKTFGILTLLVGLIFLMDSCGPTIVRTNRPVVYRPAAPARVVVAPAPIVVIRRYNPPVRPVRTTVRLRF
jgi:hypothetical protein